MVARTEHAVAYAGFGHRYPTLEVHSLSPQREPWRHLSVVEPVAAATIAGHGGDGYRLALDAVADLLEAP